MRQDGANTIGGVLCCLWFIEWKRVHRSAPRYCDINGRGK
jgi:hypothetical protein